MTGANHEPAGAVNLCLVHGAYAGPAFARCRRAIHHRAGGRGLPVILASGACTAEAHSRHSCCDVTHPAYSWAFDKKSQCIDRCQQLNSVKDLNYHAILRDGTTDRVLENNLHGKGNTSDLVLHGQLMDEKPEEVSLGEILRTTAAESNTGTKTTCERALEARRQALRDSLGATYRLWRDSIIALGRKQMADKKPHANPSPSSHLAQ